MSDVPVESTVLTRVSFRLLVPHGVRSSEWDLVFISQVDILPRLIELGIHFVYLSPFFFLPPSASGLFPSFFFLLEGLSPGGFEVVGSAEVEVELAFVVVITS